MKTNTTLVLTAAVVLSSGAALADEGNNSLRIGAYFVHYDANATDISGPYVPAGVNLKVDDVTTVYFAYIRRLSANYALEFAGGIPPKTNTVAQGPAKLGSVPYNGQTIGTSKWFSPTVLLLYRFRDESAALRPYLGAGFNYTKFFDNRSTAAGDAANGGATHIDLSDSFGWAWTAGIGYRFNDTWGINLSYSQSQVDSDMTATTAGVKRHTSIQFNPTAVVLSLGYSF